MRRSVPHRTAPQPNRTHLTFIMLSTSSFRAASIAARSAFLFDLAAFAVSSTGAPPPPPPPPFPFPFGPPPPLPLGGLASSGAAMPPVAAYSSRQRIMVHTTKGSRRAGGYIRGEGGGVEYKTGLLYTYYY